jgi:chemotaxis signal transduction protein
MAQDAIFALIPITALMIPVVAIASQSVKRLIQFKEKQLEVMGSQTAEKAAQYAAQVERLEQRMRVLERIVTDKGIDTADQIEALRTAQLPDPRHDRA